LADPVYFDSSVFLAIFMGESSGPSIKELLKELKRDKTKIYTSIVTIQEVSVQTFRRGATASDNFTKVSKLARIEGITKDIALTAAKLEAHVIDQTKVKDREDNKRRKWDCFHVATAMEMGCRTFYAIDDKLLKRKDQLGITNIAFSKPVPRSLPLLPEDIPPIEIGAEKTDGKAVGQGIASPAATKDNQLQADTAHPAPVQGSDDGRTEGEATGEDRQPKNQKAKTEN
jgi:predicted nucleic acid-binding protein